MGDYLADTNLLSELVKPLANDKVVRWFRQVGPARLFVSVISLGEIRVGIAQLPESRKKQVLDDWFQNGLRGIFANEPIPVSSTIAERWGNLSGLMKRRGQTLAVADGLIAATALEYGLTVVTRNVRDFLGTGAAVFSPWGDEAG